MIAAPPRSSRAVLALGSNLGDREATIRAAVRDIAAIESVTLVAASGLVESLAIKPAGVDAASPSYLNAVVLVETSLSGDQLLDAVNQIENSHGRVRTEHWGDRTLDIDIIWIDGVTSTTPRLTIPHPRAAERAFVLVPWLEIDPEAVIPGQGRIADLISSAPDEAWPYPAAPLMAQVTE